MNSTLTQYWAIGFAYIFQVILMLPVFLIFSISQFRKYSGVVQMFRNQYVSLSFAVSLLHWLNMLLYIFYYFPLKDLTTEFPVSLIVIYVRNSFLIFSHVIHGYLVYLRSKHVFENVRNEYLQFMKFLVFLSACFGVLDLIFSTINYNVTNDQVVMLFTAFALCVSASVTVIDFLSTFAFYRYVKRSHSEMEQDGLLVANRSNYLKTERIAERSVMICLIASVGAIAFWIYQGLPADAILVVDTFWLFLFYQLSWTVVSVMWLTLKIELDRMEAVPPSSSVISLGSSKSSR
jgi:hypothetical protein